jgi:hypothetical protein
MLGSMVIRSVEIKISMKFNITTSYQKMFLYIYPSFYSQRELMPTLKVFHSEHRHSKLSFQVQKTQWVSRLALLKKFKIWVYWIFFQLIFNIPAQKFFGSVQRKIFGQDLDSTKMGSNRFENFEQVQILIVRKIFLNIPAQKFFGLVQSMIMWDITRYVSTDYTVHFGPRTANPGSIAYSHRYGQDQLIRMKNSPRQKATPWRRDNHKRK